MVALTPFALLLSLSAAVLAVPLGTARVKPTTTDVWSLVPTTSIASKTPTSTTFSATAYTFTPSCPSEKPYYNYYTRTCSCTVTPYAETCSVNKLGRIVPETCSYGYTTGGSKIACALCLNGGYREITAEGVTTHHEVPECKGLGYTTTTPPQKYITPLVPSNYTPPPTTKPTSTFSVRGRTSTV